VNLKNSLKHLPTPPQIFRESKSAKFCLAFRQQSPMTHSGFKMKQNIGNLKPSPKAPMTELLFDLNNLLIPSQFLQGINNRKIWPKFGF